MLGEPDICEREAEPKPWSSDDMERDRDVGDEEPLFVADMCGGTEAGSGGGGGGGILACTTSAGGGDVKEDEADC